MKWSNKKLWLIAPLACVLILNLTGVCEKMGDRLAQIVQPYTSTPSLEDRFGQIGQPIILTVPADYNHTTWLKTFSEKNHAELDWYHPGITDANFSHVTTKLVPGQKFVVKIFRVRTVEASSKHALAFLRRKNAVLVGAQGLALLFDQAKDRLPKGLGYVSLDKKGALWKGYHGYRVMPYMVVRRDGSFSFCLGRFKGTWGEEDALLCFCNEK
jgi:hypothetical protein